MSLPLYLSTQLPRLDFNFRPHALPSLLKYESSISRMMDRFSRHYKDMKWPELNRPLLLLRLVKELKLPRK